jgi:hypothetical protein
MPDGGRPDSDRLPPLSDLRDDIQPDTIYNSFYLDPHRFLPVFRFLQFSEGLKVDKNT